MESPASWNLLGLIPMAAGTVVLAWVLVEGLRQAHRLPVTMEGFASPYVLTGGPYAVTRNPMYVAELALWFGWAILFGSLAVAVGFVGLCLALVLVVPWEERALEKRFGDAYRDYRATVPRWLGKRKRAGGPTRG
jgi:protein-S-isoprenylcysteine O-methyltransferase Ste14